MSVECALDNEAQVGRPVTIAAVSGVVPACSHIVCLTGGDQYAYERQRRLILVEDLMRTDTVAVAGFLALSDLRSPFGRWGEAHGRGDGDSAADDCFQESRSASDPSSADRSNECRRNEPLSMVS
jgi:hypothetical protein